jgi:NADPH-dependent glutamate synthase beta subunit-like oxidoreductase
VLVIGGGSVASDAALAARRAGAGRARLVCLEREQEMPALESEIRELKAQGIQIENSWGPKQITSPSKISFVRCTSVFDADGEFSPRFDASETADWEFDQLILAVGQAAEPALANYLKHVLDFDGSVSVDPQTLRVEDRKALFAGGDIVRGAGTVIQAVADGRRAAAAIHAQLSRRRNPAP